MGKKAMQNKYIRTVSLPKITEKEKYEALKYQKGDKLKAKFFLNKPHIRECTFLENINNKFLLVSLGDYKECITVRDIV